MFNRLNNKWLKKLLGPVGIGAAVVTILSGCVGEVEIRRGRTYSDRVWHSDPYCYGRGYGCGSYYGGGGRIRVIERRRWDDGRGWNRRGDGFRRGGDGFGRGRHGGGFGRGGRGGPGHGGHGRGGRHLIEAQATTLAPELQSRVTWQEEFNLSNKAVNYMRTSFAQALDGNKAPLEAIGLSNGDIRSMTQFRLPADGSIAAAAAKLGVEFQDLKDFTEVFLLRMKEAFSNNEPF